MCLALGCRSRHWSRGSHRLRLVLKDLPGLLLVAQLLDAFPLQVARLALLKQGVGSPVPPQELGGCAGAQDWDKYAQRATDLDLFCKVITFSSAMCLYSTNQNMAAFSNL